VPADPGGCRHRRGRGRGHGPAGPQGPAGTFGSIHTFNQTTDLPNGVAATLNIACDTDTPISGGVNLGEPVINVAIDTDHPVPESGTPTSWEVTVANASGLDLTMSVDVVCVTPAGSGSSAAASQTQGARIIKEVLTKLPKTAGAWCGAGRRARRSARRRVRGSCEAAMDQESWPRLPMEPESRADAGATLEITCGVVRSVYGGGPAA
jgi:hypothetical protein